MADPIIPLCNVAMRIFVDLAATAGPNSDFARGREALGEGWADVAVQALRAAMKALLTDDEVLADLAARGDLAARERLLGVAQVAVTAVAVHG